MRVGHDAAAAVELYRATGEQAFLDEAMSKAGAVADHNYSLCYNNNDDLAAYGLAKLGAADKAGLLQKMADRYKGSVNAAGVGTIGDGWGRLRFPMNQSFAVGLAAKLKGAAGVDAFAWKNLDYVLGANSAGLSFLVGFGAKSAQRPIDDAIVVFWGIKSHARGEHRYLTQKIHPRFSERKLFSENR